MTEVLLLFPFFFRLGLLGVTRTGREEHERVGVRGV
jgi:hypothetical protein